MAAVLTRAVAACLTEPSYQERGEGLKPKAFMAVTSVLCNAGTTTL